MYSRNSSCLFHHRPWRVLERGGQTPPLSPKHPTRWCPFNTLTARYEISCTSFHGLPLDVQGNSYWQPATNLIHDFTDVTFSMKLAFFREIRDVAWILTLLLSFMKIFRVLSTTFVQILLFATCHTSALSSWHVFTVLLTYIQSWVLT